MPDWSPEIRRRLAGAPLRPEREAEIVDEVAQHLEDRYRERLRLGLPADTAAAGAWAELDDEGMLRREIARIEPASLPLPPPGAPRRGAWIAALWQDTRLAVRRLRSQPAFAATAIVTLMFSIGPATAVMGVADYLFFRPLPGASAPDRLFNVSFGRKTPTGLTVYFISYANADAMLAGATSIAGMTGTQSVSAGLSRPGAEPRRETGEAVRFNYFGVMGVSMTAGRAFLADEDASPGGAASVVLSGSLARSLFGSAEAAVGQSLRLNSEPFTVVGVTHPAFEGSRSVKSRFWITGMAYRRLTHVPPARWPYEANRGPFYQFIVRAAPGATIQEADAELRARAAGLADTGGDGQALFKTIGPQMNPGLGAPLTLDRRAFETVRLLTVVAGLLVVLGMANTANLLVFRSLKSAREVAIRKALGASVSRLIQSTLVESLVLALAGATAGVGVALGIQVFLSDVDLWRLGPLTVPLDWRVLGGTAALALLVGAGFGVGPAIVAARGTLAAGLARGQRTDAPSAARFRQALAAVQLALSLALLVGALLFLSTLQQLGRVDLGIDPAGLTMASIDLRSHGYDKPRMLAYHADLLERLRHDPGIDRVAITYNVPIAGGNYSSLVYLPGQDRKTSSVEITVNGVTSAFFDVFRMKILQGRAFTDAETSGASATDSPIVLSAAAARRLFGDADPIGRQILEAPADIRTVVGVAADVRWQKVTGEPDVVMYQPWSAFGLNTSQAVVVARSSRPSTEVARRFRQAAAAIDPAVPLFPEKTMAAVIARGVAEQQLFARVLGLLGVIGFMLAAVGLHALVSQTVRERSREFGIRIAIGAGRRDILGLLLRQAGRVTGAGLAVGLTAAAIGGRWIEASLFGVTSRDPSVYASAATMLLVVVGIALVGPARAATGVRTSSVLRND
jgi:predicted permease